MSREVAGPTAALVGADGGAVAGTGAVAGAGAGAVAVAGTGTGTGEGTGAEGGSGIPQQLVFGSPRHAVTAYALALTGAVERALAERTAGTDVVSGAASAAAGLAAVRAEHADDVLRALPNIRNLHVQFTDRLFGDTPEQAAQLIEELARRVRLTVTLHDLPQPSDGERNLPRRAAAYARVVRAARGVVCNSRHEALLLAEYTVREPGAGSGAVAVASAEPAVIPLPVDLVAGGPGAIDPIATRPEAAAGGALPEAAILGYFYPGKGHREVIAAVDAGGALLAVTALGAAAPGHESELAAIVDTAAEKGVAFRATGYLDDAALLERCRAVAVPVAAHQHLSASASINTWIAAGRRPLVPDGRYAREMAGLRPGTLTLYDPAELSAALAFALAHPESTRLAPAAVTRPSLADTARQYLAWWEGLA